MWSRLRDDPPSLLRPRGVGGRTWQRGQAGVGRRSPRRSGPAGKGKPLGDRAFARSASNARASAACRQPGNTRASRSPGVQAKASCPAASRHAVTPWKRPSGQCLHLTAARTGRQMGSPAVGSPAVAAWRAGVGCNARAGIPWTPFQSTLTPRRGMAGRGHGGRQMI